MVSGKTATNNPLKRGTQLKEHPKRQKIRQEVYQEEKMHIRNGSICKRVVTAPGAGPKGTQRHRREGCAGASEGGI